MTDKSTITGYFLSIKPKEYFSQGGYKTHLRMTLSALRAKMLEWKADTALLKARRSRNGL